jgi:hypothetical protein
MTGVISATTKAKTEEAPFVEVSIVEGDYGQPAIKVEVQSVIKPTLYANKIVEFTEHNVPKVVTATGGALAEHLNESHGDRLDTDKCAKLAFAMYQRIFN